jgi:hypothetical protein
MQCHNRLVIKVGAGGRHFVGGDGSPFFWLGDTPWLLLYRLTREDADEYLRDRAGKRFNVIQVMGLSEFGGSHPVNAYGEMPMADLDPRKPNERFFAHADWVIRRAGELGITAAFLPSWGDKTGPVMWGKGPVIFDEEKARAWGRWLGRRWRDVDNLVWVLGGDRPAYLDEPSNGQPAGDWRPIHRAMAEGLAEGDGGRHLRSYHPASWVSSAQQLHDETWLDFNMIQSGHHARNKPNYAMVTRDRERTPPKPVLDAEICYEDHAVNWDPANGWFDDYDIRKAAWWSVLAGACGVTYGSSDIFTFQAPGAEMPHFCGRLHWKDALGLPGAGQLRHLRALAESRGFPSWEPDAGIIAGDQGEGAWHIQSARATDGNCAVAYLASGREVEINAGSLRGKKIGAWWLDPRKGEAIPAGTHDRDHVPRLRPPMCSPGIDWVLVLEDASSGRLPGL